MIEKKCPTCSDIFITKRKHQQCCSRLCYRRQPRVRKLYNKRTNEYQKRHSREPIRRYKKLAHKCKHRNIELSITQEENFDLISKSCHYCDIVTNETGCGLDRIDSNIGYTLLNVVPCCGSCNQIKNVHLTKIEMEIAMKAVLAYRNKDMILKMLG